MRKLLVTGARGQIGSYLVPSMISKYGIKNVIVTDVNETIEMQKNFPGMIYSQLDVTDNVKFEKIVKEEGVTDIIHLASILSALAEKYPDIAKRVNIDAIVTSCELAKKYKTRLLIPSTIAVYGIDAPRTNVDLKIKPNPSTLYGVSKVFMENLGHYYKVKHGVDFRSLRYIGVMSPIEYAYNGSTDYASEVFYKIKRGENYDICLNKNRKLPMAYIDDIVDGTIKLLEASSDRLTQSVYNINCVDFDPEQIMAQLIKKFPKFEFRYKPDLRDEYAKTWPYNYDDHDARKDWGWNPKYDSLDKIIKKMIEETKI